MEFPPASCSKARAGPEQTPAIVRSACDKHGLAFLTPSGQVPGPIEDPDAANGARLRDDVTPNPAPTAVAGGPPSRVSRGPLFSFRRLRPCHYRVIQAGGQYPGAAGSGG